MRYGIARLVAAVALATLSLGTRLCRAGMPLFAGIEEATAKGPRTEAVNLAAYRRVAYVAAGARADGADGSKEHPFATVRSALDAPQLMVWGNVSGETDSFLIPGTFRPAEGSPCRHLGAYAGRPWASARGGCSRSERSLA